MTLMTHDAAEAAHATAQQVADMKRMRLLATALLAVMAGLFVLTSALSHRWPWLAFPRAFAEAAIVGACADWFAVVALFRHPFGVPIPHTAIIPGQKTRIAEAVGRFIATNFLAPEEVTARIDRLDAAQWLAEWLQDPEHQTMILTRSQGLLPTLLDLLHEDQIRTFSRRLIASGIDSVELAPLLARGLSVLLAQGYYDAGFDVAADAARAFLKRHQDDIRKRVAKTSISWIPGWVDVRIVDAVLAEVIATLATARNDSAHPWRAEGRRAVQRLVARLADDQALSARCEAFKAKLLDQPVIEGYLEWASEAVEARLRSELGGEGALMAGAGGREAIAALGRWLHTDSHIRAIMNEWTRRILLNTVVASRDEIGRFVSGVVSRWDTATLVDRIELQVGKDLQYIRVNGTVVGGSVGLIIYILTRLF